MKNTELLEKLVEDITTDPDVEAEGVALEQYLDDLQGI